ncbi:hypothetical protein [Rhodopirellula sp. P2]|uniref:hypothetical protein n=1 Tax=Rhodopirellula sp. P2 TaxID=2127060 RepID=UPI0023678F9B|nr:hypothetical protein [Rhodopirellula sp. P2]WDQ18616.1 hypothetical protein PSR62_08745 [Rhodopirellula sp. P2]
MDRYSGQIHAPASQRHLDANDRSPRFPSKIATIFSGWRGCVRLAACLLFAIVFATHATAQPPGTTPLPEIIRGESGGITPDAFLFLDESGTPVVMPRMSFEEIDRLRRLEQGIQVQDRRATLQRINLVGSAHDQRAEFELDCHFVIDPRSTREGTSTPIVLDLGLNGFHLLEPAMVQMVPNDDDASHNKGSGERDSDLDTESDEASSDAGPERELARAFVRVAQSKAAARDELLDAASSATTNGNTALGNSSRANAGLSYELVLPAEAASPNNPIDCICKLKMSTRVRRLGPLTSFLPLSLPTVPTRVEISVDPLQWDPNKSSPPLITAEIVGNGREVLRQLARRESDSEDESKRRSRFEIDSQGGEFAFKWQWLPSATQAARLLETESNATLRWESPADPPTMQVQMIVRNLRGQLDDFEIELPERAVLLGSPEVAINEDNRENGLSPDTNGGDEVSDTAFETGTAMDVSDSGWTMTLLGDDPPNSATSQTQPKTNPLPESSSAPTRRVRFSTDRADAMTSTSLVEVRLQLRLPVPEASATTPWIMQLPRVPDAIGHRGTVTVVTAEDHRLRWRPRLGVEAIASDAATVNVGERAQTFRFLRDAFQLPVWLSGKQRQQRLKIAIDLSMTNRLARSVMTVQSSGAGIDPQDMQLDLSGWHLTHLTADDAETELDVSISEGLVQWQADASDGKWPRQYVITCERVVTEQMVSDPLTLTLPKLQTNESSSAVTEASLHVTDAKRLQWSVDLSQSENLQRINNDSSSRFRLLSVDGPWNVTGNFTERPLRLSLAGGTSMGTQGNQWISQTRWTLTSTIDLEGILPFEIPTPYEQNVQWTSVVDGVPAMVRESESDSHSDGWVKYEIVTPRLSVGTHEIELVSRSLLRDLLHAPKISKTLIRPESEAVNGIEPSAVVDDTGDANTIANGSAETSDQPTLANGENSPSDASEQDGVSENSQDGALGSATDHPSNTDPPPIVDQILVAIPTPIADQVTLEKDYRLNLPNSVTDGVGQIWIATVGDERLLAGTRQLASPENGAAPILTNEWSLTSIPDAPFSLRFQQESLEESPVRVTRAVLRSLVGQRTRHEQLIAVVEGGQQISIGLSEQLKTIRIETRLNGNLIATSRGRSGLRIDIPAIASANPTQTNESAPPSRHLLDIRLWTETEASPWWTSIEPLMQLPIGSAQIDWQLSVPTDSHLFWASSSCGRLMRWEREQLRLSRQPIVDDTELLEWVTFPFQDNTSLLSSLKESTANAAFTVPSNQYLFYSSDPYSFSALTVSRTLMWLAVGSLSLLLAASTQLFPKSRHPFAIILLAVVLAGVLVAAPDGVIVTAQLIMISLVLVAVFYAISALISPPTSERVLQSSGASRASEKIPPYGSTHLNRKGQGSSPGSRSVTHESADPHAPSGSSRRRVDSGQRSNEGLDSLPNSLDEGIDEEGATASHSPGTSS